MDIDLKKHNFDGTSIADIPKDILDLIIIREKYWEYYKSITPEVDKLMLQWKQCIGRVDPTKSCFGDYNQKWRFEKKLMKEKFNVNWPTKQDLNLDTKIK